ncbi:MAG TPA: hypothetical protein VJX67_25895 [Blastocatellia bacterium]|nr:hypothetical protein [Blastocatellia bacterium]
MQRRTFRTYLALAATTGLLVAGSWSANGQVARGREIAQKTLPSVVLLVIDTGIEDKLNFGSAFFVAPDVVATNFHVVDGAIKGFAKFTAMKRLMRSKGSWGSTRRATLPWSS